MKEATYRGREDKSFFITDREFKIAMTAWDNKKSFYCERLGSLLPPTPIVTPVNENEFYMIKDDQEIILYHNPDERRPELERWQWRTRDSSSYQSYRFKDEDEYREFKKCIYTWDDKIEWFFTEKNKLLK